MKSLKSIKNDLFEKYQKIIFGISACFYALEDAEISTDNFSFYTSVSSVFSSKIEGENIHLDSFIKYKRFQIEFQPDYTKKIDDLYEAYIFAQNHSLNRENLFQAHKILTRNILIKSQQGGLRTSNMFVLTENGQIEYVATSPFEVEREIEFFFEELNELICEKMSIEEVFFYASALHLMFVKIHPMNDGNGRLARLLEKWFLSEKLGKKVWWLASERYYYQNYHQYYHNLRKLGLEYEELDFTKSLDFLVMLGKSILENQKFK